MGVYLAVLEIAVSSMLFVTSAEKRIHFLSKKLMGGEPNYTKLEELALALVYTTRKL